MYRQDSINPITLQANGSDNVNASPAIQGDVILRTMSVEEAVDETLRRTSSIIDVAALNNPEDGQDEAAVDEMETSSVESMPAPQACPSTLGCTSHTSTSLEPLAEEEVIDMEEEEIEVVPSPPVSTLVYSWGRGDQGALLHQDIKDHAAADSLVVFNHTRHVVQIATNTYHTAAVTATGEVLTCGGNDEGQAWPEDGMAVSPVSQEGAEEEEGKRQMIVRPVLLEALNTVRVTEVACGLYHTACLTSNGTVVSFGGNEVGQLGHSPGKLTNVPPKATLVRGCISVAAGDLYTVFLTAHGEVLTCGLGSCCGGGNGIDRPTPAAVGGLTSVPVISIAAGSSHAVAITAMGTAFSWGVNSHGQAGVAEPALLLSPEPMTCRGDDDGQSSPSIVHGIISAACGLHHTAVVTVDGGVMVCGRNRHGQLGLDPSITPQSATLIALQLESETQITQAACGLNHTLLLDSSGVCYGMGSDAYGQIGAPDSSAAAINGMTDSIKHTDSINGDPKRARLTEEGNPVDSPVEQRWRVSRCMLPSPTDMESCQNMEESGSTVPPRVVFISAGGDQSFAVAVPQSGIDTEDTQAGAVNDSDDVSIGYGPKIGLHDKTGGSAPGSAPGLKRLFSVAVTLPTNPIERSLAEFNSLIRATEAEAPNARARLLKAVADTYRHPAMLSASFLSLEPPTAVNGMLVKRHSYIAAPDIDGLERLQVGLINMGPDVARTLTDAVQAAVKTLLPLAKEILRPEALRSIMTYWICPVMSDSTLLSFCTILLELPLDAQKLLLRWVNDFVPPEVFKSRLLSPLQALLTQHLRKARGHGIAVPTLSIVLQWLHSVNEVTQKVSYGEFYNEGISSIPLESLMADLNAKIASQSNSSRPRHYLSAFPFLIDATAKQQLIRAEAESEQMSAIQRGSIRYDPSSGGLVFQPFLVLNVEREHLLQQTLQQVSAVPSQMLKKPLRVIFAGEEGVDEGGVRKEFFQLLVERLFDVGYGMFIHLPAKDHDGTGAELWFNKDCTWNEEEYQLVGVLLGLAVYNGVLLDVRFPLIVYRKLLGHPLGLRDVASIDADLHRGLQQLLDYQENDVEEVFCRNFEVEWEEFGVTRKHELKPGGAEIPVTAVNRASYVALYVAWLLRDSVSSQFNAFEKGFRRCVGGNALNLMREEELELLVAGSDVVDFRDLEKVTQYESGYAPDHATIKQFWEVVHSFDAESKRRLLMFSTGTMRAPAGGLSKLPFKIQRSGPDTDALPTAHTCFNTLLLPEYASEEKLRERLTRAVVECEGFGLK